MLAEAVVGLLDQERAQGPFPPGAFADALSEARGAWLVRLPTETEGAAVRGRLADLARQWDAVGPGGHLDLTFRRPPGQDVHADGPPPLR